jgi:hypothetical protein
MNEIYYKEKLSEFVNHELPNNERQTVAEHLLQCADCRKEHDEIKFGAALASRLQRADAPENLWRKIENTLDKKEEKAKVSLIPNFSFFGSHAFVAAASLLIIFGLIAGVYVGLLRNETPEIAKNETPIQNKNVEISQITPTPSETISNQNTNSQFSPDVQNQPSNSENSEIQVQPRIINSKDKTLPKVTPKETNASQKNPLTAWNVETIDGMPKAGNQIIAEKGKLAVGEFLVTDANSRAKIQVANIGQVEIEPNSRVQLVNTSSSEHRLSLERGILQAKILAPPRLFIVDTPSAMAVDLGCAYTLEVDDEGNSKLHVTSGFVALEKGGRESIVPAGAMAITIKGKGIGTPFAEDSSSELQTALYKLDFENGGNEALQTIINKADLYDSITLWHLLSRVPEKERGKVFDALANLVKPPANVAREGVLKLNKKMLDAWWKDVEDVWFN